MTPVCYDPNLYALCQGRCGVREIAKLIPDDNDPPGLCDSCGGQTCNGGCCMEPTALREFVEGLN